MTCGSVKRRISDYIDGRLRESELAKVEAHLRRCSSCDLEFHDLGSIRSSLQNLPKVKSPHFLRTRLRVMASHERRVVLEADGSPWLLNWNQWKFRFRQMMRPLTIPATGGFCASLLLFGALVFTMKSSTSDVAAYEVPIQWNNHLDANLVPVELRSSIVVTLSLDGHGRITDYAFRDNSRSVVGDTATLQHHNISVPDMPVGVMTASEPVSSDIRISFTPMSFRR